MKLLACYYDSITSNESHFFGIIDEKDKSTALQYFKNMTSIYNDTLISNIKFEHVSENDAIGLLEFETTITIDNSEIICDSEVYTVKDLIEKLSQYKESDELDINDEEISIVIKNKLTFGDIGFFKRKFQVSYVNTIRSIMRNDERELENVCEFKKVKETFIENIEKMNLSEEEKTKLKNI